MCHYCGCRQVPLIRDFIAEHEEVTELGAQALHTIGQGRTQEAAGMVAAMRELLRSHWQGEEDGVFAMMAEADPMYADYVAPLVQEHRELDAFLGAIDLEQPEHVARLRHEMAELAEHISREEDGLFPATLVSLSGLAWDTAIEAWRAAHPGRELIQD